jgi:hypothetical protein
MKIGVLILLLWLMGLGLMSPTAAIINDLGMATKALVGCPK